MINKWWKLLEGKKTYIGVALYFVLGGLLYLGIIGEKDTLIIGTWITAWTGFALRDSIRRIK